MVPCLETHPNPVRNPEPFHYPMVVIPKPLEMDILIRATYTVDLLLYRYLLTDRTHIIYCYIGRIKQSDFD